MLKGNEQRVVFLYEEKRTKKKVIVKHFDGTGDIYKKLLSVNHPNLSRILMVKEDSMVIVVEDYIEGERLDEYLKNHGCTPKTMQKFMLQLLDALSVLHSLEIVHRDIKPENIIINEEGNLVLIDYNASRLTKEDALEDTRRMGTDGYAAPEQYGTGQTDARADFYAVGVLMNVMLTGDFPTRNLYQGEYTSVIEKCIRVNREQRYADENEFHRALCDAPRIYRLEKRKVAIRVFTITLIGIIVLAGSICYVAMKKQKELEAKRQQEIEREKELELARMQEAVAVSENDRRETQRQVGLYTEKLVEEETLRLEKEENERLLEEQQKLKNKVNQEIGKTDSMQQENTEEMEGKTSLYLQWDAVEQEVINQLQEYYPQCEFVDSQMEMRKQCSVKREKDFYIIVRDKYIYSEEEREQIQTDEVKKCVQSIIKTAKDEGYTIEDGSYLMFISCLSWSPRQAEIKWIIGKPVAGKSL